MKIEIKEDIVSYPIAKLANELGFTRETMGFKTSSVRKDYYNHKGEFNGNCVDSIRELLDDNGTNLYSLIAAPTHAILQKWLRDIHAIDVQPICTYKNGPTREYHLGIIFVKDNMVDTVIIKDTKHGIEINKRFDTYYNALDNGLYDALEMIKNVK